MDWVPLRDYDDGINREDRPRSLSEAEISYITSHFPLAPSADPYAAEVIREGIVSWMKAVMREGKICPSAIPELISAMLTMHQQSLITPGTPIGITAAEAVGATTTQMTLNTFHSSGSQRSASFGIEAMRDLIFARKTRKNEVCTIYFTDKTISFAEVLNSRRYIVGSVVSDFISNYDIDTPQVLPRYWWHDAAPLLLKKELPQSTRVMRLFLNTSEMFKQGVSIALLASVLERETPARLTAIYGPIGDGIIDLYPFSDRIMETLTLRNLPNMSSDLAELTYLETIVYPELPLIRVKGVSGIKQLFPLVSPVWRMVLLERKVQSSELQPTEAYRLGRAWFLFYNHDIMKMTGLRAENLAALCQLAGLQIIGGTEDKLMVELPEDRYRTQNGDTVLKHGNQYLREMTGLQSFDDTLYKEIPDEAFRSVPELAFEALDRDLWRPIPANELRVIDGKRYREVYSDELLELNQRTYQILPLELQLDSNGRNQLGDQMIRFEDEYLRNQYGRFIPASEIRFIEGKSYRRLHRDRWAMTKGGALEQLDLDFWVSIPSPELLQEGNEAFRLIHPENLAIEAGAYYEIGSNKIIKLNDLKPGDYVSAKVSADKRQIQNQKREQSDANIKRARDLPEPQRRILMRKQIVIPPTPLMRAAEFVIAETDGSNLKEIMALPGIDKTLTTCNNMYTITETLGIEAARTFLIRELTNTITNTGSYVHPANLSFIAEFITSRGEPYGATYTGISRQPGRFISLASLERAGKVFTQSALHGRKEDIRNVSASVAVGARMAIGSGAFEVAQDITTDGVTEVVLNDDLFEALDRDDGTQELRATQATPMVQPEDLMSAINELQGLTVGEFSFDLAGAENETSVISGPDIQPMGLVDAVPKFVSKINQPQPSIAQTEMIDILHQIKFGHPSISALNPVQLPEPSPEPQPIVSLGLVAPATLEPPSALTEIPAELNDLLRQYMSTLDFGASDEEEEEEPILSPQAPPGRRIDLPTISIPDLPELSGIQLGRDIITLRREQVRDLNVIDTEALHGVLSQKP